MSPLEGEEVSTAKAAEYLGVTERTIRNYLKSRQIKGQKVGKTWYVEVQSLFEIRPKGMPISKVKLPPIKNSRSRHQHEKVFKSKKPWQKNIDPIQRGPMKLGAFRLLHEVHKIFLQMESELHPEAAIFIKQEIFSLSDDLGAGYYSYGETKLTLYFRARARAGRLAARANVLSLPNGLIDGIYQFCDALVALCRRMESRIYREKSAKNLTTTIDVNEKPEEVKSL